MKSLEKEFRSHSAFLSKRDTTAAAARHTTTSASSLTHHHYLSSSSSVLSLEDEAVEAATKLRCELANFETLAARTRLPWLDKDLYRSELLAGASVATLPRIVKLNSILETVASLSERIKKCCEVRERLLQRLVDDFCAFRNPHHPRSCDAALHKEACGVMREIDDVSDEIVALILAWRKQLVHPLPFLYREENYFLRMAAQTSLGKPVAVMAGHLRSTCRHLPFYYQSAYDPVMAEASPLLMHRELVILRQEHASQLEWCERMLVLSQMGTYIPVLKFRHRGSGGLGCIMLDNKKCKEQLMKSYASALHSLKRLRSTQDSNLTSAMQQFAATSSKVLSLRYLRVWIKFAFQRAARRKRAMDLELVSVKRMVSRMFTVWMVKLNLRKAKLAKGRMLQDLCERRLRQRYMRTLYSKATLSRLQRMAKRAAYLRYFHAMHFVASRKLITTQRTAAALPFLELVNTLRVAPYTLFVRDTANTRAALV